MVRRGLGYGVLAVTMGAMLLGTGCSLKAGAKAAPTAEPAALEQGPLTIMAEAEVVPVRGVALSFPGGGVLAEVPVAVGDEVSAGQLLARLDTRTLELERVRAEADLAAAQARLDQLKQGPTAEQRAAAEQNLSAAQAAYEALLHPSDAELAALRADVEKTKALVDQAQAAYDRMGGDSRPGNTGTQQHVQLQMAWLDYQKALALYDARTKPTEAQVQQALAALDNARSALAGLQPSEAELAGAQAAVDGARAACDLAAERVEQASLTAPFAGVVTALAVQAGQYVAPGTEVVRLADTSAWQVETTDLTELSVVDIHEGDPAHVTLDAIPDLELAGHVARIQGYGENRQGDIVYKVTIALDNQDPRLRWNMTARVTIAPAQ